MADPTEIKLIIFDVDGVLLASANSRSAGRRLLELHAEACRRAGRAEMARRALRPGPRDRFTLEKGAAALHHEFRDVRLHVRDGPLVLAFAITMAAGGLIIWEGHNIAGLTVMSSMGLLGLRAIYGWSFEPAIVEEGVPAHH